jgi:hypothetical protein
MHLEDLAFYESVKFDPVQGLSCFASSLGHSLSPSPLDINRFLENLVFCLKEPLLSLRSRGLDLGAGHRHLNLDMISKT